MDKNPAAIRINGQNYSEYKLNLLIAKKLSLPQLPDWERELFAFLEEWYFSSDFIEVRTSGSTSEPQTIQLPKTTMQQSASRTIEFFGLQQENRLLLSLPCRFIGGKMMVVRAIVGQMDLVTVDPASDFDFLLSEAFNFGAMVPNQVFKLLGSPSGKEKLENIHNLLIGGSAIPETLEAQISKLKNRIVSTYGMTETASHIAIRELSGENRSDVYHCLPGISVTTGKNDCLQIHVSECPPAREVGEEPLQTKDIAEILSPNSFRILGRMDDVIISGGIKYWPETIEKKLEPVITGRFVISSLPDDKLGEKLVLVVEGEPADISLIQQKTAELLPPFERPKAVYFLEKFPETANSKLKRKEIKGAIQSL